MIIQSTYNMRRFYPCSNHYDFNERKYIMILYYIDRQPVSAKKAKDYLNEAMGLPCNFSQVDMDTVSNYWQNKAYSEEAREQIHNITAALPAGGLEIIKD